MDDRFKIYIEQLRDGHIEAISESFSPDFLEVQEKDLRFPNPIEVKGEAYLAEDNLVLHLTIATTAIIPCSICNEPVSVKIDIDGLYYAIPVEEIRAGIFNFREILRESVILEAPALSECNDGHCPQRKEIEKYLKKDRVPSDLDLDEGYQPFADIDFDK